ncbi:MAG: hypothetical protein H6R40_957 [Gemmatimonadetes bacterium]|nr:hypothetical protein [Gemmatimonadota bacterium]
MPWLPPSARPALIVAESLRRVRHPEDVLSVAPVAARAVAAAIARGVAPERATLVVIDEAHRFREPATRRYEHLAPVLVGRQVLLLTATPAVNGLEDVAHQLALALPDDCLAPQGTPSLAEAFRAGKVPVDIDRAIIRSVSPSDQPRRLGRSMMPQGAEQRDSLRVLRQMDRLRLSTDPTTRNLVRGVLTMALASSPAAFRETLSRYRHLLLHQRDAAEGGRRLGRRALRRALMGDLGQLVWWPLLAEEDSESDLVPEDLSRLDRLIAVARAAEADKDAKVARLQGVLSDGQPTIVFTNARATVHYLRRRLTPRSRIAWCCGSEAGIGPARLSRSRVLSCFRPGQAGVPERLAPAVLVTTDVAAEGLDLQRAGRIVHYDLPWTAVRLEQRNGRALRSGSLHQSVDVVRFEPASGVERRLGLNAAVERKAALPDRLGLEDTSAAWDRRSWIAAIAGSGIACRGFSRIVAAETVTLAGAELWGSEERVTAYALVRRPGGTWTDSPAEVESALAQALGAARSWPLSRRAARHDLASLRRFLHGRLTQAVAACHLPCAPDPVLRGAIGAVLRHGQEATRRRDHEAMRTTAAALAFLRGGMTAGERHLVGLLVRVSPAELPSLLHRLPAARPRAAPDRIVITGMVRIAPGR